MRALVLGENESVNLRVREVLVRTVFDCPVAQLMRLDAGEKAVAQRRPDLIVLCMSPEPERGLDLLGRIRAITRAHIVAVGPADDAKFILRTLREGANEFLDEAQLEGELDQFASRFVTMNSDTKPGRVLAVLAASGGSGSSTIAANLATALARKHQSTALLDLNLGTEDLPSLLNLKPIHNLSDLCQNLDRLDRSMFEQLFVRHSSGVHLLAAPSDLADCARVTPKGVRQAVIMAASVYPYVVIDLDRALRQEHIEAMQQADELLLLLRLEVTSVRKTARMLDRLNQMGIDHGRIRLVANRYGQSKELSINTAEEAIGMKVHFFIPDDPRSVLRANTKGVPVVLDRPWSRVSRRIKGMAVSLNGWHHSS